MALVAALLAVPGWAWAEEQKTYRLTIGEVVVDIDPGETLDVTMPDGKQTKVTLEANEFATYAGNMFSYVHPAGVAITKTELDKTINQYLMASALGTMVIVQEYAVDQSGLAEPADAAGADQGIGPGGRRTDAAADDTQTRRRKGADRIACDGEDAHRRDGFRDH